MDDLLKNFAKVREVLQQAKWPGVEEGLSWGTPALTVRGKMLVRIREDNILVIRCEMHEKEFLMQAAPDIFFETDHYKGYPAVLAHLDKIGNEELAEQIEKTWRRLATKKMVELYSARQA